MKKRLRGGFTSLELILTLAVVLIISTLASVKALENHKENALEKLYVDTTQLLSQFVATDNLNSYVGFLRAGPSCLDANTYDSAGTRVNFEQFKTCLGDDLGMYKEDIIDTGANSYYLHKILPCTLKMSGSTTSNSDFKLVLDCSSIDDAEYRTNIITRMNDYTQSRDMWINLHVSNVVDTDKKILTMNLRM